MAEPIGPGDWVECVDVSSRHHRSPEYYAALRQLTLGRLYRVVGLSRRVSYTGNVGLLLDGVEAAYEAEGYGWAFDRFRPIYRPRAPLIESLKAPPKRAPKRQREAA